MDKLPNLVKQWLAGEVPPPPVVQLVGMRLLEAQEGAARVALQTGQQHYNPMGTVHGGILCDLADAAMGVAMASTILNGETFTTSELSIHYFRPVQVALLTATAKVIHRGRSTGYIECEIHDEGGRLIAKSASTCKVQSNRLNPEVP